MKSHHHDPDDSEDFEIVEEPVTPPRKKKRDRVEDGDEPKRKKKKKKLVKEPVEDSEPNEWIIPLVLMGLGLILTIAGTIGYARGPDAELSAGAAVAFRLLGQLIGIPITIVALIGIGTVMGIEYGTLTSTIRNLAALGLFMGGMLDVLDWFRLPWFVCQPILLIIGLGLLMSLFGLDVDEAMATIVGLNFMSFLLKLALFMIVMMMVHKAVNKGGLDRPDRSHPPGWVDPGEEDPDQDEPRPKAKGKGKNPKNGNGRPPVVPINPDDD